MYAKGVPSFTCLSRFFHRLPRNADGKRNLLTCGLTVYKNGRSYTLSTEHIINSVLKRHHSLCSRHHVVDYRVVFYNNNCFQSFNFEFLKLKCGFSSCVSNARMYVAVPPQSGMVRCSVTGHSGLKPPDNRSSRCCGFFSTAVPVDGQGKPVDQVSELEALAKKILESARKKDVMAGSVPPRKVVSLLEALRQQGFALDLVTNILSQQLQFLREPESLTSLTDLLLSHGLRRSCIIRFLENIPFIENNAALKQLKISVDDSIMYLRVLGFEEEDINLFLRMESRIFVTDRETLNFLFSQLKGLFSAAEVFNVIRNSPNVFCDSWDETREKFDYVYFQMQYKQAAVVKSFLFQHSLNHITDRHTFLVRAGLFHSVKEKDDPKINPNPPLADVIDMPDKAFTKLFGGFRLEEYMAYLNMRDAEREEQDSNTFDDDDDDDYSSASDDDDNDNSNVSLEEDEIEEKDKFHKTAKNTQLKRK